MIYSDKELNSLRELVKKRLSEKRFMHTLGVEKAAERIGKILLPELVSELKAAALLHDIAKEIPIQKQIDMLSENKFVLTDDDIETEGIIHSFSAPIVIKNDFPDFATENILSAVFNHTVGCGDMTLFDKIIFISDYIEETRIYPSCIATREMLYDGLEETSKTDKVKVLNKACIASIDGTITSLEKHNSKVNPRMAETKKILQNQVL